MAEKNKQPLPIIISPQAKQDITNILQYLKDNWSQKTIDNFLQKLEIFYSIISINPNLFGYYNRNKRIRKYALTKHNIIYYRTRKNIIEIITVFDGRQNPNKLKTIIKKS
jgi:plasmid stabilization system protein ParE